jgi:hypothetical protein
MHVTSDMFMAAWSAAAYSGHGSALMMIWPGYCAVRVCENAGSPMRRCSTGLCMLEGSVETHKLFRDAAMPCMHREQCSTRHGLHASRSGRMLHA